MNTLALYYRASNDDGSLGESSTIQNQRDLLRHYIQERSEFSDWNVLEFQDDGWSGTTFNRPGIQKLLKLAGNAIPCIIVKDFSRFGRNLIEVGNYLDQVFPFLSVRFIAVNEGYDSKNNAGRTIGLDVSLKAMVYEMYSRDLSKKISSVKEAQMKKGRYTGSFAFYGYQKSKTTKSGLAIDPDAAETVKRIFSLASAGKGTLQIAVLLNQEGILPPLSYRRQKNPNENYSCPTATVHNVWTQKRVSDIIQDERYTGVLISKKRQRLDISTAKQQTLDQSQWIRAENALEAIITTQEYEQAQNVLLARGKRVQSETLELFRGLLKCGHCGKALEKIPCKNVYYRCPTGRVQPKSPCVQIRVDKKELQQKVLSSLKYQILLIQHEARPDVCARQETDIPQKLEQLNNELRKYKSEQVIVFERFAEGILDKKQFAMEKSVIAGRLSEIQAEREILLTQLESITQTKQVQAQDLGQYSFMEHLTREMLVEFVRKICIYNNHAIEIDWNFREMEIPGKPL